MKSFQQYGNLVPADQKTGPLFAAGQFTPPHVTTTLRHLLKPAGYNSRLYSSHSFCIGVATTSAAAGLLPWLIKTLGRWSSDAYMTCIHCPTQILRTIPALLAKTNASGHQAWNPDEH